MISFILRFQIFVLEFDMDIKKKMEGEKNIKLKNWAKFEDSQVALQLMI